MNEHIAADLGELEREVLRLVWKLGPVTAEAMREALKRPLKESTVRTVLRRLEDKGHVTHTVEGRTYVFKASQARAHAAARAVKRIADWFCEGSVEEVVAGLVDARLLDEAELQRLTGKVARARTRGPKRQRK
jgi:BlaI family transcriptional regulator, penicillinase repressor